MDLLESMNRVIELFECLGYVMDLFEASRYGNLEVVKYLVSCGANINDKDEWGNTSLIYASKHGKLEIVKYLIDNGANVNDTNNFGGTALMKASYRGYLEIVKYLVKHNTNINHRSNKGINALLESYPHKRKGYRRSTEYYRYTHYWTCMDAYYCNIYLCREYIIKNIILVGKEKHIIKKYSEKNKLFVYHYNPGILFKHDKIILDMIDNKIDIYADLIKYILRY